MYTLIYPESCVRCGCCAVTVTHCVRCVCVCVVFSKSSVVQCSNSLCLSVVQCAVLCIWSPGVITVKAGNAGHTLNLETIISMKKPKHTPK